MLETPSMLRYSSYDEICVGYEANINESLGSENSPAADNQQERLIKIGWITGFVDGEGCFSIHVVRIDEAIELDSKWHMSLRLRKVRRALSVSNNESLQASPGNDQNPQRLHARHRIQPGEDIVRSAWRHAG